MGGGLSNIDSALREEMLTAFTLQHQDVVTAIAYCYSAVRAYLHQINVIIMRSSSSSSSSSSSKQQYRFQQPKLELVLTNASSSIRGYCGVQIQLNGEAVVLL